VRDALTRNISASGLLFETEEQIPIDTELKIMLVMPGGVNKTFELVGRVVRIDKLLPFSRFEIGVHFIIISREQKEEIRKRLERMNIIGLLDRINRQDISDLHLTVDSPPMVRSYGVLKPLDEEPLSAEEIQHMAYSILTDEQKEEFELHMELDFSFSPYLYSRYRVSIYRQRQATEIVFRNIMPNIRTREELGLPPIIDELCQLKDGIVIIGGTTGSGKTTTICTMMDIINKHRGGVVLSLEKPIEYLHENIKAIVKQREVGVDVPFFANGIRAALRQDADVIVVGEILDFDSIEAALEAAETGHLVITSLHSTDTVQVFDRIISFFPLETRNYVYARLSHSLKAIIIQNLLARRDGIGRVLATEVCVANIAVKRTISSGDFTQLASVIQTSSQYKMHTMQDSLDRLYRQGLISPETYEIYSNRLHHK
jgi:twitching motility protein PilT